MDPRAVMDHQYEAFAAGSADEIVRDFSDDAVLIRADAVFDGRAAIRGAYREMFAGRFKPGTYDLTVDAEHIHGDVAYIAWRARCATEDIVLGMDTFVFRDGKILAQTYTAKIEPRNV